MTEPIGTLVILGAGGDLSKRLLLPGVGQLLDADPEAGFALIGVGQNPMPEGEWHAQVLESFQAAGATGARAAGVAERSHYLQADVTQPEELQSILSKCDGVPALYFALPPTVTIAVCTALAELELPEGIVLALEKPFGSNLQSARDLNRQLQKLVPENQVHRVDHFLGKSTVLNLLGLRFANRIFEQVWDRDNVERVEIIFDEQLALEGRAGYYDSAGALIDMVQSHLLQVLAVFAMEPPSSIDADDLRGAIAQVLRATRAQADDPVTASRRARYSAGQIGDRQVPAYVTEPGIDPSRNTETLAELTVEIQNWRWAGVPFLLRSGKALGEARKLIIVTFRDVPHLPTGFAGKEGPAQLRILLGPDKIELDLTMNGQADPFELDRVKLSASFGSGELGPYGEVLSGIVSADPMLSVRADAVEECWRIVSPVLDAWRNDLVPLEDYPAGTSGPVHWPVPSN